MDSGQESPVKNLLQIMAYAAVSFVLFFFVSPDRQLKLAAILVCSIGGTMAARAHWKLRHHAWFWFTLAVLAITEGIAIFLMPSSSARFPGAILLPLGLADFAVIYGIIKLVQSLQPNDSSTDLFPHS